MKHNIIILLSLFLVVFSCDKEDPYIKIEQTNLHLSSVGGLRTISFVSNKGWTANSSAQWCRVSNASGDASMSSSIEVTVDANDTYEKRSCTVTITVDGVSNVATITQDAKTGIIVSKARYELLNNAETIVVEVKSNIHFDVNISKEAQKWITQVDTRGLSATTLMFDIARNESYGNREGTITFSESFGDLKDVIQVFQSQEDAIILSKNRYNLTENAHKLDVEVKSNVDYKVIIPKEAQSWVSYVETRALRSETVVLAVAKNVDYNARSSEIYIKNIATNLQDTLIITQAANRGLIVSEDEYYLSDKEGVVEIEVMANVKFNIEISDNAQDWISEIETRGLTETKLQFSIAKNRGYSRREGSITISEKDGSLSTTIKVYQSQKDAIIISKKLVEVSKEAQQIDVDLKTNVSNFDIVIPEEFSEWVSYVETRALRNETIVLNIAENSHYDTRSAKVYIKDRATNLQDTLTIIQDANTALVLDQDEFILSDKETVIEVEVLTNVKFDVAISDDWISQVKTRGLSESMLQFRITANDSYADREATITLSNKAGKLEGVIKVSQAQNDGIIISDKIVDISFESQLVEVELKTNLEEFEVVVSDKSKDWISVVNTRGLRAESFTLNVGKNEGYTLRTAEVYVKNEFSNVEDTITINQRPDFIFFVPEKIFNLTSEKETVEVEVNSNFNVDLEVIIPKDAEEWISYVETRALKSKSVILNISDNQAFTPRSAKVYIKDRSTNLQEAITINQDESFQFDYDLSLLCDGEWRATLVRGNKRWDLTTPVNELYNEPTYLKFDMDGSLTSEGAFGKGVGRYTTQGKMINTFVGEDNESFEVTYLDSNTAKIMVNANLFHLPQITSYWEVVEVTLTKNYGREIDFDYDIENLYGKWRAMSIDRAINNKGEDVFDRSVNLTTPAMEDEIAPSYIAFEAGGELFIEGIFGEGGGKYTTRGVTFYILTDKNELSEVETTALDGNIAKIRVDLDKVGFNFGKYQGTLDSWNVKTVTLTLTKQADK